MGEIAADMTQIESQQMLETARAYHHAGRLAEARQLYQQILASDPNSAEATHLSGVLDLQEGNLPSAIQRITRAIELNPYAAHYHSNLGQALLTAGRREEAIASLRISLTLAPGSADTMNNLGNALRTIGDRDGALAIYRQAIALAPRFVEAYTNLAELYRELGRYDEAIACCKTALSLRPESFEAFNHLGNVLCDQRKLNDAVAAYQRAIALRPNAAEAHSNFGNALRLKGDLESAVAEYSRALELQPGLISAQNNLGIALRESGKLAEAIDASRKAVALDPKWPTAQYNLGLSLLLKGDLASGWDGYEYRTQLPELAISHQHFPGKLWIGEDISGQRILLHAEQGLGDSIQFVRYVPLVAKRAAQVSLQVPHELVRLFECVPGVTNLIARGQPLPAYDVQLPLLSLPKSFGTTLETIPSDVPYLRADQALVDAWAGELTQSGKKIGLVWAGRAQHYDDRNRSMALEMLSPLFELQDVAIYSLQKGEPAGQIRAFAKQDRLIDLGRKLTDLADTAAVLANLDLLISVDTGVAHLAGAIGKPVWVLLPYSPDWRWMRDRSDSPWYPTMRLFRQSRRGDWSDVLQQVVAALQDFRAGAGS